MWDIVITLRVSDCRWAIHNLIYLSPTGRTQTWRELIFIGWFYIWSWWKSRSWLANTRGCAWPVTLESRQSNGQMSNIFSESLLNKGKWKYHSRDNLIIILSIFFLIFRRLIIFYKLWLIWLYTRTIIHITNACYIIVALTVSDSTLKYMSH